MPSHRLDGWDYRQLLYSNSTEFQWVQYNRKGKIDGQDFGPLWRGGIFLDVIQLGPEDRLYLAWHNIDLQASNERGGWFSLCTRWSILSLDVHSPPNPPGSLGLGPCGHHYNLTSLSTSSDWIKTQVPDLCWGKWHCAQSHVVIQSSLS